MSSSVYSSPAPSSDSRTDRGVGQRVVELGDTSVHHDPLSSPGLCVSRSLPRHRQGRDTQVYRRPVWTLSPTVSRTGRTIRLRSTLRPFLICDPSL